MFKRFVSIILSLSVMLASFSYGVVFAEDESKTEEISNQYIKVVVNTENGGYVISTLEGDILKKSDNNAYLTHRGEYFDTSFTSFKIGSDEYVFGEKHSLLGLGAFNVETERSADGSFIKSTWRIGDFEAEQKISLVNNEASEQLGTAMITYTVKNNSGSAKEIKSRVLIDTQLGDKDYGYYEVPKQNLGQGYEYFEFERTWDSYADPKIKMPADYFVRDNPYSSSIVGYGVNSVFTEQKPYKMTFAHWANIASTVFDYEPDEKLNFTNNLNSKKTADSAAALYYDLGTVNPGDEKSFSTYYGVTANLKNKENKIIVNTTAPAKLEFSDAGRTSYKENPVRINVNLTNPYYAGKDYKKLAVVVYALGFETQRQTDLGNWEAYDNKNPVFSEIIDFKSGENRVTYFDFKFTPDKCAQLGSFVIKVFDMDEEVNELGYYAEEYCLAESENHIILPGTDNNLPAITLTGLSPDIIYNRDIRYLTVTGKGMEFFQSTLLDKIYLEGDNGTIYDIPLENIIFDRTKSPESISIMLESYMEPGRYTLHFIWKDDKISDVLKGVPEDFTSDAMVVGVSSDIKYCNSYYGIVAVCRSGNNKYKISAYKDEAEFENAGIKEEDLLLSFRGDIQKDRANPNFYRLVGKDKDVNINHTLNYRGGDLTLEELSDGTVEVLMDGKITTVGANTTVRNGTAAFRLKGGTEYIIPEYDSNGNVDEATSTLSSNQDFIELKWDNAFDTLTTIGGFLIDMKYGVLGKIANDDGTKSDIISFGGSLDLSFMTPGGAAAVRQNTAAGARWTTDYEEIQHDDLDDGYTFGLAFDEDAGEFRSQVKEKDVPPTNNKASRVEAGAEIRNILYGGKKGGYLGINMSAHIAMPQIVKFLPNKIEGNLEVNTIGGYRVGVDAEVETANLALSMALVVVKSESGAPVPDKMYFSIGGFEPGINVDGLGIVWITGGGGGLDNLYDTIYGKDGIPPLTLLLHVEFDITKILTGNADLELSLRSLKISLDSMSLKMLKDAEFIDGGEIAVGWYPNFNLNLSAGVNFMQIMKGRFTITAAAGKDTADFVQFVLNVSLGLPGYIPIIGGMELASAELGGGSEKVWGSVEVLSLIRVGFTYYWGGSVEFTHGSAGGTENFAALSSADDIGVQRTKRLYNEILKPVEVGKNSATGKTQFASVGGNLLYSAGSVAVSDFDERVKNLNSHAIEPADLGSAQTEIFTNGERTSHIVTFGDSCDYILSVSRADGKDISADDIKNHMSIKCGNAPYGLRYYTAPEKDASDTEKREALKRANVNITKNAAYIAVPKADALKSLLIEFSDGEGYDVGAIKVNPLSTLTSCSAEVSGQNLIVKWDGVNITDSAKIIVSATDSGVQNEIVLNENEISAKAKSAVIKIPDKMPSGDYVIKVTLSDEDTAYNSLYTEKVAISDPNAPNGAESVTIENCGDDKLKINVVTNDGNFDGYLVEVYEGASVAETGLYFEKGEDIIVGGRYAMPVLDKDGNPTGEVKTVGYNPGKEYSARVRLCNIKNNSDGSEIYHSSAYKTSNVAVLKESTPPEIDIAYDEKTDVLKVNSDVTVSGELYINSILTDGDWLNGQKTNLADGEYTIEFFASDSDGDHAIVKKIISVDKTAPVIMLSSPKNGDCFGGDGITITAAAERDAEYMFKINGNIVSPKESSIFKDETMKCTIPLGEAKNLARLELEIIAADKSGNETVKNITLTNKNISKITSIGIEGADKEISGGKMILSENETAYLKVYGMLSDGEKIDITDMPGTAIDTIGNSAAVLDGAKVAASFAGQTLVRASFALGGNEFLYDGIVIETKENGLIYSALEDVLAEAKKITDIGYTAESWNNLQNAISGAEKLLTAQGITQNDIDSAATSVSNAVANLKTKGSGASGADSAYYTVSFNTNGAGSVKSQKIKMSHKAVRPENPSRKGYVFDGWYADKYLTVPYDFDTPVTKSFTLYAKWSEAENKGDEWQNPFDDVSYDDWYYENIEYAVKNGLFKGTDEKTFSPNGAVLRAMLVTVLYRAEGEPPAEGNVLFGDVEDNAYYKNAVVWAEKNGIIKGVSEKEFAPNDAVTREQTAAIMHRYAKYKGYDVSREENTDILSYTDADDISKYAVLPIRYAVGANLMKGKTETTINPGDIVTRAEIAAILQRFMQKYK